MFPTGITENNPAQAPYVKASPILGWYCSVMIQELAAAHYM